MLSEKINILLRSFFRYHYLKSNHAIELILESEKKLIQQRLKSLNDSEVKALKDAWPLYLQKQLYLQKITDDKFEKELNLNLN